MSAPPPAAPVPAAPVHPTPFEQLLVELVNRARADPAGEAARLGIGLDDGRDGPPLGAAPRPPLAPNPALLAAARRHGVWMIAADVFAHDGEAGSTPADRAAAEGYGWPVGENIAFQGTTGALEIDADLVRAQHAGLFRSPGHRENMLSAPWREIGAGQATGAFAMDGVVYDASMVVVKMGASRGPAFLTGVVIDDRDGDGFYDPGEGVGGVRVTATGAAGVFETETAPAGGYALALPAGAYAVAFERDGLARVVEVEIDAVNVKRDALVEALLPAPTIAPPAGGDAVDFRARIVGLAVSGDAPPGAAIEVALGAAVEAVRAAPGGGWSARLSGAALPPDGAVMVAARLRAADGAAGPEAARAVPVDPPPGPVVALPPGDSRLILGAPATAIAGGDDMVAGAGLLSGGAGSSLLAGGAGDDVLVAAGGGDVLRGGPGADLFLFVARAAEAGSGPVFDFVEDFTPGEDRLALAGFAAADPADLAPRAVAGGLLLTLGPDRFVTLRGVAGPLDAGDVVFDAGDPRPDAALAAPAPIRLTDGADRLVTRHDGPITVFAGAGDDVVAATGTGGATLHGGPGSDLLIGGPGDDLLVGGPGSDVMRGGGGADVFLFRADDAPDAGLEVDFVEDFAPGRDRIALDGLPAASLADLAPRALPGGLALTLAPDWLLVLRGVAALEDGDVVFG